MHCWTQTVIQVFQLYDHSYEKQAKRWHKWSVLQTFNDHNHILMCLQEFSLSSCHCHGFRYRLLTSGSCCKTDFEAPDIGKVGLEQRTKVSDPVCVCRCEHKTFLIFVFRKLSTRRWFTSLFQTR